MSSLELPRSPLTAPGLPWCAQLIEKFGIDNLMEWHGCATAEAAWDVLLQYGDDVLEKRFSMTDDVTTRRALVPPS